MLSNGDIILLAVIIFANVLCFALGFLAALEFRRKTSSSDSPTHLSGREKKRSISGLSGSLVAPTPEAIAKRTGAGSGPGSRSGTGSGKRGSTSTRILDARKKKPDSEFLDPLKRLNDWKEIESAPPSTRSSQGQHRG